MLYQVVWLRLAFAAFGIVTPVISVLISVFMAGLFIGSWAGGKWINILIEKTRLSPIFFYGLAELIIGIGGLVVTHLFSLGQNYLLGLGEMDSLPYLLVSGIWIFFSILPWCICMGATFPFMMGYVKSTKVIDESSFSFLYLANVIGAMCGTAGSAVVLIELLGFSSTLLVASCFNFLIAAISFVLGTRHQRESPSSAPAVNPNIRAENFIKADTVERSRKNAIFGILFLTGFVTMAMEVVWIRAFTPVIYTKIYAFALLLTVYLLATCLGSYWYRKNRAGNKIYSIEKIIAWLAFTSLLPLVLNDPRLHPLKVTTLLSIFPFCFFLGYLTPKLIDEYSGGWADRAGKAYAVNIFGCIIGPLIAGYILLPFIGTKWALLVLAAPFTIWLLISARKLTKQQKIIMVSSLLLVVLSAAAIKTFEDVTIYKNGVVRRDYTATVISDGEGMNKHLLVNGVGITYLTTVTKFMAHLPLSFLPRKPDSALMICFGMGTTYRSLMSWGINTTAVELVPSVRDAFGFYFSDAATIMSEKNGKVVIDDGRRYLKRTTKKFDVITLDPPPPVEAAGSSLLYSGEFYNLVKARLNDQGILQQWVPETEETIIQAVARSLANSFPYIKVYKRFDFETPGYHFIAATHPIAPLTALEMYERMPQNAKKDLMEWLPGKDTLQIISTMLSQEIPLSQLLNPNEKILISDDRPFNEYFLLRRTVKYLFP